MTSAAPGWPSGPMIAVSVSVMLEGWSEGAAPGVGPMGNPLPPGILDRQARSWAEYGPKVGAWRLLDVLADARVTAVFYVSGILAGAYPELLRAIAGAGHVVAAHAWGQDVIPAMQQREDEARDVVRCRDALERASGQKIRGWLSPRCTPSADTAELLAASGFVWQADAFDADLPAVQQTPAGPLVAVPFTMEVNDMPLYVRYGNEPSAFTEVFERIVTGWPAPDGRPFCLDITVHAHVFGRPYGAVEFENTLAIARRLPERIWLTNHAEHARLLAPNGFI
jgi:hypothetical protein